MALDRAASAEVKLVKKRAKQEVTAAVLVRVIHCCLDPRDAVSGNEPRPREEEDNVMRAKQRTDEQQRGDKWEQWQRNCMITECISQGA